MQTVVFVVLGVFLCGVHGQEERADPDTNSIIRALQTLQAEMKTVKTEVKSLQSLQTEVKSLQSLQTKVENLENSQTQQQNSAVAFYASLSTTAANGKHGPFNVVTTIKYNIVWTNAGNAYNANTGIFTAPVKGLYVFHFTVFTSMSDPANTGVALKKNTENWSVIAYGPPAGPQDYGTRVAVVTLETGDTVFMELVADKFVYAPFGGTNSFSGFLLSPM